MNTRRRTLRNQANDAARRIAERLANPDRISLTELWRMQGDIMRLAAAVFSLLCHERGVRDGD